MRMLLGALAGVAPSDLAGALAGLRAPCTVIFEADGEVKKKSAKKKTAGRPHTQKKKGFVPVFY
jgi:hypothetical protein